jgi:tRNA(Ile)-lysidine synthase
LCNSEGYDYILTAHHANDEIETFFINLSRGTGLRGLTGIPHTNNRVLRPLLPFTRVAILAYAKEESIYWREDSSNAKRDYLRNEIRHDLVPVFEKLSPKSFSNFKNTQRNLRASEHLIDDYIVLVTQMVVSETADGFKINVQKLNQLPHTKELLYELLSPYGFTAWNDISDLLDAQSGKQILSNSYRLIKDRECFILSENVLKDDLTYEISLDCENLNDPINLSFKKVSNFEITNANTIFVDADTLNYPLKLRKWEKGDFMYPFGLKGKKKLSKLFKDEKLSLLAKENTWVLLSDDSIVWVVGVRADDRFKVKKSTKRIIKIDYTPK